MKIRSAEHRADAAEFADCPPSAWPEFAFVGRSNVGKSSLINALTGRNELAHTSGKPGKTRLIHFFRVNGEWTLVDLPGYGYAKLSRGKQQAFNQEVSAYLTQRENLKQVFLLADSQLEPLDGDLSFANWLQESGVPYSLVLTKTDRNTQGKVERHLELFDEALADYGLKPTRVFRCSAKTGKGCGTILRWIDEQLPKKAGKRKSPAVNLNWMRP